MISRRRRENWTDLNAKARRWNPWGTAAPTLAANDQEDSEDTSRPLDPNYLRALTRWTYRDRCLRIATYYRVLHLHSRAQRAATLQRLRRRFASWALSFVQYIKHSARLTAHNIHTSDLRASRQGHISARTRMHMHSVDLYRESRRNMPRKLQTQRSSPRRRTRLPTLIDAEVGSLLYNSMCTVASRFLSWLTRDPG